ncbi:MAG: hypothetical protein COV99_01840 [Bacteroidetes bacterium CG12_big_fil_rev_8_21_14_0_65_60_17]|nr:MAG: hypothetical protein COV99_01840 [Bacteroidetes bacterium CG12_big_fil_rev_8_21_14_0_65_60_17]
MISDPTTLFAVLAAVLAGVFWLATLPRLKRFFQFMPPVIWAYFVPMILTTAGITPAQSEVYTWMSRYLLPFALFLLMLTVDLPAILKLGKTALMMMVAGTIGIMLGAPVAYLIFASVLPADAWQGLATLSGSWIGGTANMLFIKDSVGTPDSLVGPIIVVDTVVGYGWLGILVFMSTFQDRFDTWIGADKTVIEATNRRLAEVDTTREPSDTPDLAYILGLTLLVTVLSLAVATYLPDIGNPTVITSSTWGILIVVTVGIALSFTRLRRLEHRGGSKVGYLALYLLLTSIGAQADVAAVLQVPMYMLAGVVWILVHIGILLLVARWLRAPLFFVATGSMANIGGAASAPIVASVYFPAMAPIGLLMGVSGYILGIYGALFTAQLLAWMSGFLV